MYNCRKEKAEYEGGKKEGHPSDDQQSQASGNVLRP